MQSHFGPSQSHPVQARSVLHRACSLTPLLLGCKGGGLFACLATASIISELRAAVFWLQSDCTSNTTYSTIHRDRGIVHQVGQQCLDKRLP
ncbi:hypothetical protein HDV57DRAFT_149579 [Trichoderma longibrachiatum]|uniref:Uncharacterized protein n=1 Tax=Trichoderma longibrachiatum ATCC 18648 TaxID=983965 RepID=A0A2T4C745_TRILO|nr:hypothetical protein M440DRAFT_1400316 [Trichoderma longibrachiatum ATCC 18648]